MINTVGVRYEWGRVSYIDQTRNNRCPFRVNTVRVRYEWGRVSYIDITQNKSSPEATSVESTEL